MTIGHAINKARKLGMTTLYTNEIVAAELKKQGFTDEEIDALFSDEEYCLECGCASGSKIVCDDCRRVATSAQFRRWDRLFQQRIAEDAGHVCSECGIDLSVEERRPLGSADHTLTKGSRPDLRYCLKNAKYKCGAGANGCHEKRHQKGLSPR